MFLSIADNSSLRHSIAPVPRGTVPKVFVPLATSAPAPVVTEEVFSDTSDELLYFDHSGVKATGKRTSDGFVVLKGSQICSRLMKSCPDPTLRNREKYTSKVDENYVLIEDILFTSPSSAASYIGGASLSGNACWYNAEGTTLKNIDAK